MESKRTLGDRGKSAVKTPICNIFIQRNGLTLTSKDFSPFEGKTVLSLIEKVQPSRVVLIGCYSCHLLEAILFADAQRRKGGQASTSTPSLKREENEGGKSGGGASSSSANTGSSDDDKKRKREEEMEVVVIDNCQHKFVLQAKAQLEKKYANFIFLYSTNTGSCLSLLQSVLGVGGGSGGGRVDLVIINRLNDYLIALPALENGVKVIRKGRGRKKEGEKEEREGEAEAKKAKTEGNVNESGEGGGGEGEKEGKGSGKGMTGGNASRQKDADSKAREGRGVICCICDEWKDGHGFAKAWSVFEERNEVEDVTMVKDSAMRVVIANVKEVEDEEGKSSV
uniref:Uncharacterized protein n=1 Tax=Palpitomonas bilix TaxID=652834 RepID=A0A7S3D5H2_9EUKA|mmetsp:Transcript_23036/g.58404  ORF Transcript_23036/g.58404 Transcript_23036/m.58404 type:complete len:339 (+) Transcript_23036:89-1105(+)